jgi:hypothetical protein
MTTNKSAVKKAEEAEKASKDEMLQNYKDIIKDHPEFEHLLDSLDNVFSVIFTDMSMTVARLEYINEQIKKQDKAIELISTMLGELSDTLEAICPTNQKQSSGQKYLS